MIDHRGALEDIFLPAAYPSGLSNAGSTCPLPWRQEFVGLKCAHAKRMTNLEAENARLRSDARQDDPCEGGSTVVNRVLGAMVTPQEGAYGNQDKHTGSAAGCPMAAKVLASEVALLAFSAVFCWLGSPPEANKTLASSRSLRACCRVMEG